MNIHQPYKTAIVKIIVYVIAVIFISLLASRVITIKITDTKYLDGYEKGQQDLIETIATKGLTTTYKGKTINITVIEK